MAKTFKHLTKSDRIKMEALLKAGHSKAEIAEQLHVHRSTVYREIKNAPPKGRTYKEVFYVGYGATRYELLRIPFYAGILVASLG